LNRVPAGDPYAADAEAIIRGPTGDALIVRLFPLPSPSRRATAVLTIQRSAPTHDDRWAACNLTNAERRVAELLAKGHAPREICDTLCITENTLKTHRARIYAKLGIDSQAKLAALAAGGHFTNIDTP
jgi:DNA-binding CsgD family transcriptional regulator